MTHAAIYLRSSKDRHDLSLDAQRRALHDYARDQGLSIVQEFGDAVESGKDEDRPGFQQLLRELKNPQRGWQSILALDTSRIARRRHIALIFEHECEKAGIRVLYRSVPDTDPVTGMLLRSILQAMDEWHSLTSKAKGLAGMAEAVRQGWRAGGRAPRGYRLEHTPTGTIREGQPVIRSKLLPTEDLPAIGLYLQARASGKPRGVASAVSGVTGSLNDLEWSSLTYAGHTVWGQTAERKGGTYLGGTKRRPRAEWHVSRNTHQAVITDAEAEAILTQLEARGGRRNRDQEHVYLLSGVLESPGGESFCGEWSKGHGNYRVGPRGRRIACSLLDRAVLEQIFADLKAPETAEMLAQRMRALAAPQGKPRDLEALRKRLAGLDRKISRLVDLIAEDAEAAPAYRRAISQMEADRIAVEAELEAAATENAQAELVALWTPADVARLLEGLREELTAELEDDQVRGVRDAMVKLVDKVVYNLETRHFEIHYKVYAGFNVASPRGFHVAPVTWRSGGQVRRLALRA